MWDSYVVEKMSASGCIPFEETSAEGSSEGYGAGSMTPGQYGLRTSELCVDDGIDNTGYLWSVIYDDGEPRPAGECELVYLKHSEKVDVNHAWGGAELVIGSAGVACTAGGVVGAAGEIVGIAGGHHPPGQFRLYGRERVLKQPPDKKRKSVYECRMQELETRLHAEVEQHKSAEQRLQKKIKELEEEKARKVAQVESYKLQFEQQAIRLEDQENRLTELMLIIDDTEKTLAPLTNRPSRIQFAHGHPENKGRCYWLFHKYQLSVVEAVKPNVAGIADEFAREGLISPVMEELLSNSSIPSDTRSEELVKAVQVNLDSNPDNFRKVIGILRGAKDLKCKRLGDRLDHDFHVSEALSSSQC